MSRAVVVSGGLGNFAAARYPAGLERVPRGRRWVQQDANYNVTSLVNVAGQVLERYQYTPYGQRTVLNADFTADLSDGKSDLNFTRGHQGLRLDAETGTYENRARQYHPTLGRFQQRDPLGYVDGGSLYQGLGSDPVGHVDPSGNKWYEGWGETFKYLVGMSDPDLTADMNAAWVAGWGRIPFTEEASLGNLTYTGELAPDDDVRQAAANSESAAKWVDCWADCMADFNKQLAAGLIGIGTGAGSVVPIPKEAAGRVLENNGVSRTIRRIGKSIVGNVRIPGKVPTTTITRVGSVIVRGLGSKSMIGDALGAKKAPVTQAAKAGLAAYIWLNVCFSNECRKECKDC